ncbi:nucleoside-diphosphate-sugar epimerase family protein [Cutaneotrichosporon oleaginosum]|uniref:Nucleoside-diphosphate-sugar epimerase family protein n=1 Tax=Cutaneotrichosporon oleaginosum TaxID=879819 RepID=A0A0J0XLL8_9TREE|nr:nucleoside-diphosphate-sugar epimerase family protein [Cutaneotrichosporon oleaginosum]KLT41985.1 nucleoside-diphosphate-sugar epimerase family protein [Cutaneotrichosporon oleaginosum]TXT14356.1 hypothetical protein COLE_00549 [Cutaneotrichosporon oleaginosum]
MTRPILVTGATGKQGGAVVQALLAKPDDMVVLAVTRNPDSAAAQKLAARGVKLVKGDLDDVPALFDAARAASPTGTVWGVFSVQPTSLNTDPVNLASNPEVKQGVALIDEALRAGVTHFVYSSVDRGGDQSWDTMTDVPHFRTKAFIEAHLRDATKDSKMSWSILRPAIFFENMTPDLTGRVVLTSVRDVMRKPMPWVATEDIGFFAALQMREHAKWAGKALSLGGEPIAWTDIDRVFRNVTGAPPPTTYSFIAAGMRWALADLGKMFAWFNDGGYRTDSAELKRLHPGMMDLEQWLRTRSAWKTESKKESS